nr:dITP/XTP pyrophosphatase [uncultured bacterium]
MNERTFPARLVVATTNRGKLREVEALLAPRGVDVFPVDAVLSGWTLVETGATFAENARAKAVDVACRVAVATLADDSGLEVDALRGAPGVYSARYAGEGATDAANVAKLLAAMRDVPAARRTAAFRCALALAWPEGEVVEVEGRCEGAIAVVPRGEGGFGYDPVFIDVATGRTFAELGAEEKNARSHRARALVALCRRFE